MIDTLKELSYNAIKYKKLYEQAQKLYEEARTILFEEMKTEGILKYETKYYTVLRAMSNAVDEEKLAEQYPEIYMAGLQCKFNLYKAREVIPARLVNVAVKDCGKVEKEHVKIQRKSQRIKGREIEGFSPSIESHEQRDYTFREFQERNNKRNKRYHARFRHTGVWRRMVRKET